jgi:hypothetical protein
MERSLLELLPNDLIIRVLTMFALPRDFVRVRRVSHAWLTLALQALRTKPALARRISQGATVVPMVSLLLWARLDIETKLLAALHSRRKYLNIQFTDHDFTQITELQQLDLSDTSIDDEAAHVIADALESGLLRNLRELLLDNTDVGLAGVERLAAAELPSALRLIDFRHAAFHMQPEIKTDQQGATYAELPAVFDRRWRKQSAVYLQPEMVIQAAPARGWKPFRFVLVEPNAAQAPQRRGRGRAAATPGLTFWVTWTCGSLVECTSFIERGQLERRGQPVQREMRVSGHWMGDEDF